MALTAAQLRKWRTHPYSIDVHLAILKPVVVFRALVNLADATYPTATIPFDNVTVGAYTDIQPEMVVRIGSAAGLEDYGRQYVKAAATSTEITVGWTSRGRRDGEIDLVDNAVIEVLDMRVIRAKIPRIDPETGSVTKDGNTGFGVYSHPVANAGTDYAQFVDDSDEISVYFDGSTSFATEPGQSLIAYDWTFPGGTPSTYAGATPGNVVFGPGWRYISLKVTDLNDRQHTAYALVHGATKGGSYDTIKNFQIVDHVRRAEGQTLKIRIDEELLATDYPAGTRVLIWCTERYGKKQTLTGTLSSGVATITGLASTTNLYVGMPITGTGVQAGATIQSVDSTTQVTMTHTATATGAQTIYFKPDNTSIAGPTGRQHMLFSGYISNEDHILEFQKYGLRRSMTISCIDAAGRLDQLVGFAIELRKASSPQTWAELSTLDIGRAIHYILQWHSNALDLTDFVWAGTDYPHPVLGIDGGSLYKMCNDRAEAIAHRFACDAWGRLKVVKDINITQVADRPTGETVDLLDSDWSSMSWSFTKSPRTHWLRGASMIISTSNADDYTPVTSFVKSPGLSPGQGPNDASTNYQLSKAASEHREREGHRYAAKQNAEYGTYSVTLAHGGEAGIDPGAEEWVRLRLSDANRSLRGDTFASGLRFLPVEIQYKYNHRLGSRIATVMLEREVVGTEAVDDPQPPEEPAPFGDWSGAGWTLDQYIPSLDLGLIGGLPTIDFGAEQAFDPPTFEGDAEAGTIGGRMIVLCRNKTTPSEWRLARVKWVSGSPTFADISPAEAIRVKVGEPVRIIHDMYDYKRVLVKGTGGVCWTNNVTVTTPSWEYLVQEPVTGLVFGTNYVTFEAGGYNNYEINAGSVSAPGYNSNYSLQSEDTGSGNVIDIDIIFNEPIHMTGGVSMVVVADGTHPFTRYYATTYDEDGVQITQHQFDRFPAPGWNSTNAGSFNDTGVKKLKITQGSIGSYVGRIDYISFTNATEVEEDSSGTAFCDFQSLPKRNTFAWLAKTGTDVYLTLTTDAFKTLQSSRIAPYDPSMIYGFSVNPHNWRQIYVVAGDPDPAITSGVYESTDGGAGFSKIATVTDRAGPIWWNWSTSVPNVKNLLRENLCFIRGLDSADVEFRRVGAASEVTIVTDADRYPGGPLALGMNARDLDYGFYVARTGHFYKTADKGATWAYTAQAPGTLARGWWQYPKDKAFAVVFGEAMFCYTVDSGANFTDVWSAFSSWADGQYGSGIIDDIVNIIIDLTQAFTTAVV